MLEQVLTELHNWFRVRDNVGGIHFGKYTIRDGGITLSFLQDNQYFRIMGSVFNDGLHRYGPDMEALKDETFEGAVWALSIPKAVVDLGEEIAAWQEKYKDTVESPYTSESFGGYSYTKTGGVNENGGAGGWQAVFRSQLNSYRRLREI